VVLDVGVTERWFERCDVKFSLELVPTFRSMYKHGSRRISEAGFTRGHAKVAVGKLNTDKTGGNAEGFIGQGCRSRDEEPLCAEIRDRYIESLFKYPNSSGNDSWNEGRVIVERRWRLYAGEPKE
jgi:hypothetical protein